MTDVSRLPDGLELHLYPAVAGSDGSFRRPPSPRVCEPGDLVPPGVLLETDPRGIPTVTVDADRCGVSSVVLAGEAPGHLVVTASSTCHARREGDGSGDVERWGRGPGTCLRDGLGDGYAVSHSPGAFALRTGNGSGSALDRSPAPAAGSPPWWRQTVDRALQATSKLPAAVAATAVLTAALTGVGPVSSDPKAQEQYLRGHHQRHEQVVDGARGHLLGQRPALATYDVEHRPSGAVADSVSRSIQYGSVRTAHIAEAMHAQLHLPGRHGGRGRLRGSRGHHQVTLEEAVENVQRAHRAGRAVIDLVRGGLADSASAATEVATPRPTERGSSRRFELGGGADLPQPGAAPATASGTAASRSAPDRSLPDRR